MNFITIADVDTILGADWTTTDKKVDSVFKANAWLSAKKFCKSLDPMPEPIKQAGAYLAKLSANDKLYVTRTDGLVAEKRVKADTVEVQKKYATGEESAKNADMLLVDDLLKPYLCSGVGSINGWVFR